MAQKITVSIGVASRLADFHDELVKLVKLYDIDIITGTDADVIAEELMQHVRARRLDQKVE